MGDELNEVDGKFSLEDFHNLMARIRSLKAVHPLPDNLKLKEIQSEEGSFWTFEDEKGNYPVGAMFSEEIKDKILEMKI